MQIKEKILKTNTSNFIRVGLETTNDQLGFDNLLNQINDNEFIEEIKNNEIVRYDFHSGGEFAITFRLIFNFFDGGSVYFPTFNCAGFSNDEILLKTSSTLNSFFILDVYDSKEQNIRKKILSTYLTKLSKSELFVDGDVKIPTSKYVLANNNQFQHLDIPKYFIDENGEDNFIKVYGEFSFYNAKTGKLHRFRKSMNTTTTEDTYFEILLDVKNNRWNFTEYVQEINLFDIKQNSIYVSRLNDTIKHNESKIQKYPVGDLFNTNNATYSKE